MHNAPGVEPEGRSPQWFPSPRQLSDKTPAAMTYLGTDRWLSDKTPSPVSILREHSGFGLALIWLVRSAAPSIIILSSLLTAMNCQPSLARLMASAAEKTWSPHGSFCALGGLADAGQRGLEDFLAGERSIGSTHRVGQVVGADENGIQAGYRVDLVGDLDGFDVLGLDDDQDLVVGPFVIFLGRGAELRECMPPPMERLP